MYHWLLSSAVGWRATDKLLCRARTCRLVTHATTSASEYDMTTPRRWRASASGRCGCRAPGAWPSLSLGYSIGFGHSSASTPARAGKIDANPSPRAGRGGAAVSWQRGYHGDRVEGSEDRTRPWAHLSEIRCLAVGASISSTLMR